LRLRFLWVGDTKDASFAQAEERYLRRIRRLTPCRRSTIPEGKKSDPRARAASQKREEELIRGKLGPRDLLVVLEEGGRQLSSVELSESLKEWMDRSVPEVTFLVGGYLGIPEGIRAKSHLRLSLGRMTLPHDLARVVLLEQVYRALTIIKGLPYHK
jgi:23S rRNA (pseudouridine1915-N3)-methyltransferase